MKFKRYISWDWLDMSYIDSDTGECYKTLDDIPPKLRHLVSCEAP